MIRDGHIGILETHKLIRFHMGLYSYHRSRFRDEVNDEMRLRYSSGTFTCIWNASKAVRQDTSAASQSPPVLRREWTILSAQATIPPIHVMPDSASANSYRSR
jgi:hypothetical protein